MMLLKGSMSRIDPHEYHLSSKEPVLVRNAEPDDANAISALMRNVFDENDYHLSVTEDFKATEDEQRQWIQKALDDPGKLILVAETGGQIVAVLEFDNDYRKRLKHQGTVWISIASNMRDKDLGTALATHGWRWVRDAQLIERVYMHVLETNKRSLALCRKMGFVEEARLKGHVKIAPNHYVDLIILSSTVRQ
jgi:RimJ/RimL family protein N-acetyltransferase